MSVTPFPAKEEKTLSAWEKFERDFLSEPLPMAKPKIKPKVQVTAELSGKVAEAAKANPASLEVRVYAEGADGTTIVERPRSRKLTEVVAADGESRPLRAREYDPETNEWTTIECDHGYCKVGVVSEYNPHDGLKRDE